MLLSFPHCLQIQRHGFQLGLPVPGLLCPGLLWSVDYSY